MDVHDKGDLVRCSAAFTDSSGNALDPTALTFKVKDPSGNVTTYTYGEDAELVKDSTGNYHVDVDADEEGAWWFRFASTGTGQAAAEGWYWVNASGFD